MASGPELRRIVGAMTDVPSPDDCDPSGPCAAGHDPTRCRWLLGLDAKNAARYTLANHADALVALVEAVERIYELGPQPMTPRQTEAFSALYRALAAVHAIPERP